jgi:hypothetical protein
MPEGNFNLTNAGVETSKLRLIGEQRRPQLAAIGGYRTTFALPYNQSHPYVFSEGIGGNNWGKEPQQPPASVTEAYNTVGSSDDIKARIGAGSPGSLSKNEYWAGGNQYDNVI